ncbi:hypothetical protein [Paracoccus sp. ME4]|uniref:hypothetical protein n=1 Tax=Paracoccus sp. ME4 TaxID=3138066 RepID=UPI00398A9FDC
MSQAAKVTFYTIPLSLIHVATFLGIFASGLMLWTADMRFIENVPVLGTVQNTPGAWAVITLVMTIVAFFTNPGLYVNRISQDVSDGISEIVGALTSMLIPLSIGLAIFSAPFFFFLAYNSGLIYLTPHLAIGIYFVLLLLVPSLK